MFGGLEKTCGEIRWRFGGNVFGDLEITYSVIFGENLSAFWRKPFGACFGDLEKLIRRNRGRRFGEIVQRFWRKLFGDFILEIIMEYCDARRPYVVIKS